ncbi:MAG: hypothetical protein C0402_10625 [Thermodesulfovibrio sp.]|nr:hypothetical protein [Thermodesulfovibrio sp.]
MKKILMITVLVGMLAFMGSAQASMTGGGNFTPGAMMGGGIGPGTMMSNGIGMANAGGFGMMNGLSSAPLVGSDGTAYIVGFNSTAAAGTTPSSNVFQSTISAVTTAGAIQTLTLKGIVSRPVLANGYLVATASLPDTTNFNVVGNLGTNSTSKSILYAVTLPLTSSSLPVALSLDGEFASVPVIVGNNIYVVTSDFGSGMMDGSNVFNMMYGNYNFSNSNAHSYMYIVDFSGKLINKITLQ